LEFDEHHYFSKIVSILKISKQISIPELSKTLSSSPEFVLDFLTRLQKITSCIILDCETVFLVNPLSLLDHYQIKTSLDLSLIPSIGKLKILLSTESTNDVIKKMLSTESSKVNICLSEHQTNGRGRRGKEWVSPFGKNIYFSMNYPAKLEHLKTGSISLWVGLGLISVLQQLSVNKLSLKWPNDIYYEDKKLAGILMESQIENSKNVNLIIGVGINVDMAEFDAKCIDQSWIDLRRIFGVNDSIPNRNQIVGMLINTLFETLESYELSGFRDIVTKWRELDYLYKKEVEVNIADSKIVGIADGINHNGELIVLVDGKPQSFCSGDVSVRKRN